MKNSAILILNTFSRLEINSFEEFLNSPFHNKNRKAIQLFELLKKFHPGYNDEKLTREYLFSELYGNELFKESYIRNLFSDLKILLENFLVHYNISNNNRRSRILIEELSGRDLMNLMYKKISSFEKEIERNKLKDQEYYQNKLFVYDTKSFSTIDNTLIDDFRKDQISSVIKYFLICIMEYSFHMVVEEQRVRIKHDLSFLKYIMEYVKKNLQEFEDVPLIMIFYYLWLGILEDDSEYNFRKARKYFKLNFSALTQPDKRNIYAVMQIYYAKKIDAGENSYNKKMLDLLLEMLEYNIISHYKKDSINLNLFRNILILCFKLGEISKLKKFISEYIQFVRKESRNTINAYSEAHVNFLNGNFETALAMSNKVDFNDLLISTNENLYFKMDIRNLIMKCLYELNSYENLFSHIEAFIQFLNNSRIIKESSRINNLNSVKAVRDMAKLKLRFEGFKLAELRRKVTESKELYGRDWLLIKLNEFEKKLPKP